jgi:hypothetical protein
VSIIGPARSAPKAVDRIRLFEAVDLLRRRERDPNQG